MAPDIGVGEPIGSTYIVSRKIGAGAFADVYHVHHRFLGEQAMKIFKTSREITGQTPVGEEPIGMNPASNLKEARQLVDLSHPRIVRVYDANIFERAGELLGYMTMEYAPRGTLDVAIARQTRLTLPESIRIGRNIAEALAYTHSLSPPLIHRDIKPSNILVTSIGSEIQVKVADFGLASALNTESRLCESAGTLAFSPPETAWGVADERTDVYSLGVTLYKLLTGIHPFPVPRLEEVRLSRKFSEVLGKGRRSIRPPSQILLEKIPELDQLVMKALSPDIFDRHRNAQEFLDEIRIIEETLTGYDGI